MAEATGNWISQLSARALPWPSSGTVIRVCFVSVRSVLCLLSAQLCHPPPSPSVFPGRPSHAPLPQPRDKFASIAYTCLWTGTCIHSVQAPSSPSQGGRNSPSPQRNSPSPQALRPALQAPTGAGGSPPSHMGVKNKEFGRTSLRLSPDTVAYSGCGPGEELSLS